MYMHAYTIYAYTLFAGGGKKGMGRVRGGGGWWKWGGGGGGWGVPVKRSKGNILYMYFLLRIVYYTCIYTHIVYVLVRVACTYAQLFGNRRLAKSLIDRSNVPF